MTCVLAYRIKNKGLVAERSCGVNNITTVETTIE